MLPTRNHAIIRAWGMRNLATPAEMLPFAYDGDPAQLRFLFGKHAVETPEVRPISWEEFFERFDLLNLSLAFEVDNTSYELVRVQLDAKSIDLH